MNSTSPHRRRLAVEFAVVFFLLTATVSLLLTGVFVPDQTLFSNDGPLGRLMAQCHHLPERFTGCWDDLNGIGANAGTATPNITIGLQYLLKPVLFSKLYAWAAIIILGLGAWCFFVNLRLAPVASILGSLAATLNSGFFSVACWGVAAQTITTGMIFFALAALMDDSSRGRWPRVCLAGLAVGMGVMEGADVGAIYSLYVAAFVVYQAWIGDGALPKKLAVGFCRVLLVALCAALVAAPAVFSLVRTNIVGSEVNRQDAQTKEAHWDWATQWSLPLREITGLVVPGLFGYRMDTPDGGAYWGEVGRDPSIDSYIDNGKHGPPPHGFMRFSGGGFYAGVPVMLLSLWAMAQASLGKASTFNRSQRLWLWFWLAVAMASALLALGRFAPFYRLVYALPYFSAIRNPVKFIYLVSFALVVIFAYGLDNLWSRYARPSGAGVAPRWAGLKVWWAKAGAIEKRWTLGCGLILAFSLLAWLKYDNERQALVNYLQSVQFNDVEADTIAAFSIRQVGWFVLFFILSAGLMVGFFSGIFAGTRARWGAVLLFLLLVTDLGRANLPWVVYWNYPEKYASNPVIDKMRNRPYEHRVAILPGPGPRDNVASLNNVYRFGWLSQQFPCYNIQSFDVIAMPRIPEDLKAFADTQNATGPGSLIRTWTLTNTRYILGPVDALDTLNHMVSSPMDHAFEIMMRFNIVPKPRVTAPNAVEQLTAMLDDNGVYALFELSETLPRAKLFSNWQCNTNDQAVLEQLASPSFDPNKCVLVSNELPANAPAKDKSSNIGTVEFVSYAPKDIVLNCNAPTPTVLLLNDHYDSMWRVLVDGQARPLLRCNFIMRGVSLPAGAHKVEFLFRSDVKLLYLSLSSTVLGFVILLALMISGRRPPARA